jgi:hypothetical protein
VKSLVPVSLLAVLASACAGTGSGEGSRTGAEPPVCRPGRGDPITEQALKQAFAREGIRLHRDGDCFVEGALVLLSNLTEAVPSEAEDGILASQGHIWCAVWETGGSSARLERFVWRNDPDPTMLRVLNVTCDIFPATTGQTDAVEQALRRLPGVSPLPSTVPSPDAVHD